MADRHRGNLLGLAVLASLFERPMHRYELAATLRERGKDRQLAVKIGSLYTVVDALARRGFVEPVGVDRDGARPERVTYAITDAGRAELRDWTRTLVAEPQQTADPFVAGLAVLPVLGPDAAQAALRSQLEQVDAQLARGRTELETATAQGVARLFLVEDEYALDQLRARRDWVARLLDELATGSFPGLGEWREVTG